MKWEMERGNVKCFWLLKQISFYYFLLFFCICNLCVFVYFDLLYCGIICNNCNVFFRFVFAFLVYYKLFVFFVLLLLIIIGCSRKFFFLWLGVWFVDLWLSLMIFLFIIYVIFAFFYKCFSCCCYY